MTMTANNYLIIIKRKFAYKYDRRLFGMIGTVTQRLREVELRPPKRTVALTVVTP